MRKLLTPPPTRRLRAVLLAAICWPMLLGAARAIPYNIILVTDNPQGETNYEAFIRDLVGDDVLITSTPGRYAILDNTRVAELEAADLVIFSRRANVANYIGPGEAAFWNTLETPLLLHNPYLARRSENDGRWDWISSTNIGASVIEKLRVKAPEDPVFNGVENDPVLFFLPTQSVSFIFSIGTGNGLLVACQPLNSTALAIIRWTDTNKSFYLGSDEKPGEERLFFTIPEAETPTEAWTANARLMLANALWSLLPPPPPLPPSLGDLVINELRYNDDDVDDKEFIELKNVSDKPAHLHFLDLVKIVEGVDEGSTRLTTKTLAPGAYWLVATDGSQALGVAVQDHVPWKLANTLNVGVELRLTSGTVVDSVVYGGLTHSENSPDTGDAGEAVGDNASLSRIPDGADTDHNAKDFATWPPTPGRRNDIDHSAYWRVR